MQKRHRIKKGECIHIDFSGTSLKRLRYQCFVYQLVRYFTLYSLSKRYYTPKVILIIYFFIYIFRITHYIFIIIVQIHKQFRYAKNNTAYKTVITFLLIFIYRFKGLWYQRFVCQLVGYFTSY